MENLVPLNQPVNDPLAVAAGNVPDPTFPLLQSGSLHRTRVVAFAISAKQDDAGNSKETLNITLETTVPTMSTEGKMLHPGHKIFVRFGLSPSEKYPMKDIVEKVNMPIKAVFGREGAKQHSVRSLAADPSPIINQLVDVQVGIEVDKSGAFPDKNNVKKWIIPA